ncbi:MAG TPA: hypothetical protein VKT77_16385 [Chthonomonadaceae bacterium]|nr:hypothetical protein [Chthonomonadaceae bacterium]
MDRRNWARIAGGIAIGAISVVAVWYVVDLNWRIARLESITHILVFAQPGARLTDVEREVGWTARRSGPGDAVGYWPLPIAKDQSVADFDSYSLPHMGGYFEFTLLVDKNDRVLAMRVRSTPNDWRPMKTGVF